MTSSPVPPLTIADVLARMRAIAEALPEADGVAWFNRLYQRVTENVARRVGTGYFADDGYIVRMDVVFASYYFRALHVNALDANRTPKCWEPLLDERSEPSIAPIVFALAGMNAHINHDLALTVYDVARERGHAPRRGSVEHDDFLRINEILRLTIDEVKPWFAEGLVGELDVALGRADDVAALFSVEKAREAAWTGGETFWALRDVTAVSEAYEASLDRLVGLASRAMLAIGAHAG
jgi:hypothetical protein